MAINITPSLSNGNPLISFSGLASGINTNALVSAEIGVDQGLQNDIAQQTSILNERQAVYNNVGASLQTLGSLAQSLQQQASILPPAATTSDPTVLTAAAGAGAAPANYTVTVNAVAAAQSNLSADFTSASQSGILNPGTLSIQVGNATAPSYISIDKTTTLNSLAADINNTQNGVTANIFNDGNGYRLQVTSKQSGTNSALQFTDSGTGLNMSDTVEQAAQNASITLNNNINLTSQNNTFANAIQGVTLQAVTTSATPQTVTIGTSSSSLASSVQNLVGDYNAIQNTINAASAFTGTYNPTSLIGDPTLHNLQGELQNIIGSASPTATGTYSSLSQLGISTQADGTLQIDNSQLQAAVNTDPQSVAALLSNSQDNTTLGIAGQLAAVTSTFGEPTTGILSQISQGISTEDARNQQAVNDMQNAANTYQSTLTQQFVILEKLMSQFTAQGAIVSSFAYQIDGAAASGLTQKTAQEQMLNQSIT